MVRFEPESQERIAGQNGRQEKKREGLVQEKNPGLAADTERPWGRLGWVSSDDWNWDLVQASLPKQDKPTENYPRGTVLTS